MIRILDKGEVQVEVSGEDLLEFVGVKMGQWVRQTLEGKSGREIMQIMVRKKKIKS